MKCKFFLFKMTLVTLIVFVITENNLNAVGSYYTESDYEQTSMYAGIIENQEDIVTVSNGNNNSNRIASSDNTKTASFTTKRTKDDRVIYNTIFLNDKNKQVSAPERVVSTKTLGKGSDRFNVYKILKDIFKQKDAPDDWYLYFDFGYSLSCHGVLKNSSVYSVNGRNDGLYSQKTSNEMKGGGFDFKTGLKVYVTSLNNGKNSFFISPEFFYSREIINNNSINYQSRQKAYVNPSSKVDFAIESSMNIDARDIYGFALRTGITLKNMFSFYTKFSLGGLKYHVTNNVNPMMYNVDWKGIVDPKDRQEILDQLKSLHKTMSKTSFLYGIGFGAEVAPFNQHLLFKIEYNFYFSNGTYAVDKTFARYASNDSGIKWRVNGYFSEIKATVGIAF